MHFKTKYNNIRWWNHTNPLFPFLQCSCCRLQHKFITIANL